MKGMHSVDGGARVPTRPCDQAGGVHLATGSHAHALTRAAGESYAPPARAGCAYRGCPCNREACAKARHLRTHAQAWPVAMILKSDWMLLALMAPRHAETTRALAEPTRSLAYQIRNRARGGGGAAAAC